MFPEVLSNKLIVKITLLGSKALSCQLEYVCLSWGTLSCHLLFPVLLLVRVCAKKWYLPSAASRKFSLATSSDSGVQKKFSHILSGGVFVLLRADSTIKLFNFSVGS